MRTSRRDGRVDEEYRGESPYLSESTVSMCVFAQRFGLDVVKLMFDVVKLMFDQQLLLRIRSNG